MEHMKQSEEGSVDVANVLKASPELEAQQVVEQKRVYRKLSIAAFLALLIFLYNFPLSLSVEVRSVVRQSPLRSALGSATTKLDILGAKLVTDSSLAETLFIDSPSQEILKHSLHEYTEHPHLAGNLALARYTRDKWLNSGIEDVEIVEYEVLLNYPTNRSQVSLYNSKKRVWSANLSEDVLEEDRGSGEAVPFFHGYSKNGSASGELVYLNYARPEDFELVSKHVQLKGKIGIARYGRLFRGLKVELAQNHGMAAILLYDDPSEDRNITTEYGYAAYPAGPARNPSSVQRGSVQFLSILPGDPSTPGYASTPGCERKDPYHSIPSIPSLPISGRDALYLLRTLNGNGPVLPGFEGAFPGVQYALGATHKTGFTVDLDNVVNYDYRPIYNVIAKIPGHFDDTIILGNHRDAWVRGASDPNSGSAALDSIVSTFASLQRTGYMPLRSLIFASWDAEEYGLVGSTEWVEEHVSELSKNTIAYLNVDVASSGINFHASASPLLFDILRDTTGAVPAVKGDASIPGTAPLTSLRDEWKGTIKTLGSGSDYTAFQDALGITSVDMGFSGGTDAIYHYHSQYDSYHWLTKFGDPDVKGLQAATRLWGLLAYRLSESPVIPFNASTYGAEIRRYVNEIPKSHSSSTKRERKGLEALKAHAKTIHHYGIDLDARAASANDKVKQWPDLSEGEKVDLLHTIHGLNDEYKHFERALLDKRGLKDRSFFKHVLFAPGRWTGYAGVVFPAINEAKSGREREDAIKRVGKILKRVGRK